MHDLLTDPVIPAARGADSGSVSLPALYAALVADEVDSFPGLAAHQAQAWYQFLSQLGALALRAAGREKPPADEHAWRESIRALTPECAATAWSLAAADPERPAFMQPPTARIAEFSEYASTPDMLDIPVTAKNHDRKQARAAAGAPHHWLYALVTLQTTQGYSGGGNYGVARMNGGYASRVLVDRRPGPRWGPRVLRAVRMLPARRGDTLKRAGGNLFRAEGGLALLWLERWDDDEGIDVGGLDPWFIEICRRLRLTAGGAGEIRALRRPSKRARTAAQALEGNLADPWTPLKRAEASALTVRPGGFDYRLAQRILLRRNEFLPPLALADIEGERERDSEIHMAVTVRGQGKTEGLYERIIPLPRSIAEQLAADPDSDDGDEPRPLAALSEEMVGQAGAARRVLRRAMLVYLQGPEAPDFQDKRADPVTARYDRAVDERFFERLFSAAENGFDAAGKAWRMFLRVQAERLARETWESAAAPSVRREKARVASEAVLYGGLRRQLPGAFAPDGNDEEKAA